MHTIRSTRETTSETTCKMREAVEERAGASLDWNTQNKDEVITEQQGESETSEQTR
mgnify:CR=1 FL=1